MLALSGIGVLIARRAVKARQTGFVLGEVRRDPVHDDAQARLVEFVDKAHEILRGAIARGGGEVARHLVAPRAVEGIFRQRHQFDVRIAHVQQVWNELVRQLVIGKDVAVRVPAPGARVHLVDVDGAAVVRLRGLVAEPRVVLPGKALNVAVDRGIVRPCFKVVGIRIALEHLRAVLLHNAELIHGVLLQLKRQDCLPNAVFTDLFEGMLLVIPVIEVSHQRNSLGVRRPDTAGHARMFGIPRSPQPHIFIGLAVGALMEQIKRNAVFGVDFLLHGTILLYANFLLLIISQR